MHLLPSDSATPVDSTRKLIRSPAKRQRHGPDADGEQVALLLLDEVVIANLGFLSERDAHGPGRLQQPPHLRHALVLAEPQLQQLRKRKTRMSLAVLNSPLVHKA